MKKLLSALAICTVAGYAMAQEVVSQNIVGYMTIEASGTYPSHGPTFITVGDTNGEWKLGNMTANGMDPLSDNIQFLSAADATVELTATYVDAVAAVDVFGDEGMQGWWDLSFENRLDTMALSAGTGFLCSFGSGNPITLMYAGEVVQASINLDMTGLLYPMIANPVPVDLTLGDITADGMDPLSDNIQFLSTTDANVELTATYVDAVAAIDVFGDAGMQGWWDLSFENRLDDVALPAGAAVLGSFGSGNPVMVVFPNPMAL
jgi:hypothetical protein